MQHDLIVMTFDREADALKVRGSLEIMRNSQMLGTLDAVAVARDGSGRVVVHRQTPLPAHEAGPARQIPDLLAAAIGGRQPEEGTQRLVDAGLDEMFVRQVSTALVPDSSMLIGYIGRDSLIDTEQVLSALGQFKGTLHYTTVPQKTEEAILLLRTTTPIAT